MKNIFYLFVFSIILLQSCNKKNTTESCETCESKDFVKSKVTILNNNYSLKKFTSKKSSDVFMYKTEDNFIEFDYLLKELNIANININEIVNLTLITENKEKNIEHEYIITKENIKGIIFYLNDTKNKNLISKIFKNENGVFVENELSNSKTSLITSNDIHKIAKLVLNNQTTTIISFINFAKLPNNGSSINDLEVNINKIISTTQSSLIIEGKIAPSSGCDEFPCNIPHNGTCSATSTGGWNCHSEISCLVNIIQDSLEKNSITYDYINIKNSLYSFRDNYLVKSDSGKKIIDYYYSLSSSLPLKELKPTLCIETYNLLNSSIIPLLVQLVNNPNLSTSLLINNDSKNIFLNYLTKIKPLFIDLESQNKIDYLIY